MRIRAAERGPYLWLRDTLDGVDHLLPRTRLLGAWLDGASCCRVACGRELPPARSALPVRVRRCRHCRAARPVWWRRMLGRR